MANVAVAAAGPGFPHLSRRRTYSLAALAALAASVAASVVTPDLNWAWVLTAALLVAFCACVGLAINSRPAGLIIDNRNRISLSKFQAAAWSVLVLSALMAAVIARIRYGLSGAAMVDVPVQLLAAMGIAATSLVATPTILAMKSGDTPPAEQVAATADKLGDAPANVVPVGKVYARRHPSGASWLDMIRGDETSNAASPDLSKMQQFLITVVVLVVYAAALWAMFTTAGQAGADHDKALSTLPDFKTNLAWLIGVSHASYLAYKAAPHGSTAPGG